MNFNNRGGGGIDTSISSDFFRIQLIIVCTYCQKNRQTKGLLLMQECAASKAAIKTSLHLQESHCVGFVLLMRRCDIPYQS